MLHRPRFNFTPTVLGPLALASALGLAVAVAYTARPAVASSTARAAVIPNQAQNQSQDGPAPDPANYTMYIYADRVADPGEEVSQTLSAWASSAAKNDVADETSFYAPRLDRYFLRRNVSREYVLRDKQSMRDHGNEIHDFKLSNLKFVALSGESATVSVSKSWILFDQRTTLAKSGSTRSLLWLRRTSDGWKITGEQDLKG